MNRPDYLIVPDPKKINESLALAEEYGFGFEFDDFFHPNILDDPYRCKELIKFYRSYDLPKVTTLHGDFFDVIIFSEDRRIRKISELRVRQSMDIAAEMGVRGVVFHTNHIPNFSVDYYISNWVEMNCRFWTKMLSEYPDLEIYIENMFDINTNAIAALAERMQHHRRFGICLDYAHACAFGNNKIDKWCKTLSPYVKHMHINDNDLVNDLHLAIGDGKINWREFALHLKNGLSPQTILIEISSVERQRRSAEYLRDLGLL